MSRTIQVQITGDASDLSRAFKDAQGSASTFGDKLQKATRGALVALGALGAGAAFSVKAASDLGEQISKTSVVFGKSSPAIQAWAETTASSIGISNRAALEAAGTFGNMLVPMGLARGKAAEMSQSMVTLAADMASFNNADPSQVLEAIRSGISGEAEPLRQFGVFLNEAGIKAKAMALGLYDGKGALDASAKAQATYAIVLEQSKDAQGDFERTSGSLANQQRLLKAELEDVAAKLGAALLPAMQRFASVLQEATSFASQHTTAVQAVAVALGSAAVAVLAVSAGVKVWTAAQAIARAATVAWTVAQWALNVALTANPIGLIIVGIAALAAGLVIAWTRSERFREVVTAAFEAVKGAAISAVGFILGAIDKWLGAYQALFEAAGRIPGVGDKFDKVAGAINRARDKIDGLKSSIDSLKDKTVTVTVVQRNIRMADEFHHRAAGGPVTAGQTYMVGERGRELFTPSTSGRIIPNNALGSRSLAMAGGGGVTLQFNNYAPINSQQQLDDMVQSAAARLRNSGRLPV